MSLTVAQAAALQKFSSACAPESVELGWQQEEKTNNSAILRFSGSAGSAILMRRKNAVGRGNCRSDAQDIQQPQTDGIDAAIIFPKRERSRGLVVHFETRAGEGHHVDPRYLSQRS